VEGAQKRNSLFPVDSQGVCVFALWRYTVHIACYMSSRDCGTGNFENVAILSTYFVFESDTGWK